ncbi:MAG: class I SAM-dependent methyltransferase [Pseudomonadota bacterium]|nr:class I SAM-dependent methyltransferase [Pseudomonadota bacterium]
MAAVLQQLHRASKGDRWIIARAIPAVLLARLKGIPVMTGMNSHLGAAFIGVPPAVGSLLYLTARAIDARHVVEFGTSFGISAVYLAAAMRDNGGHFVGSETESNKIAVARQNLDRAGLSGCSEVREGDARETFRDLAGPVDLVLLDGWKDLYLPVLKILKPKLRKGSVVFADNIFTFKKGLAPYVDYVQHPSNGFRSMTLPLGSGLEYSLYDG